MKLQMENHPLNEIDLFSRGALCIDTKQQQQQQKNERLLSLLLSFARVHTHTNTKCLVKTLGIRIQRVAKEQLARLYDE